MSRSSRRRPTACLLLACLSFAAGVPPAPAGEKRKADILLPGGARLEWRSEGKAASLKVKDVPGDPTDATAYRKGDEVIEIGGRSIRDLDLWAMLNETRRAAPLTPHAP